MLCGSLDGRAVCGRMDTCVYMTESLLEPETITILLIAYTPIKRKKKKKQSLCLAHGFSRVVGQAHWSWMVQRGFTQVLAGWLASSGLFSCVSRHLCSSCRIAQASPRGVSRQLKGTNSWYCVCQHPIGQRPSHNQAPIRDLE